MAGKRKRIQLDDRLFSTTPIQKPTILNWAAAVRWTKIDFQEEVTKQLRLALTGNIAFPEISVAQSNTAFAGALVRALTVLSQLSEAERLTICINDGLGSLSKSTVDDLTDTTLRGALTLEPEQGKLMRLLLAMGAVDYTIAALYKDVESILAPLDLYLTSAGLTLFCQIAKIPIDRD